jgi:hypothetical protein
MNRTRTLAVAAACTLTGAGGALATDAITSSAHNGSHHGFGGFRHAGFLGGGAVHVDAVVPHGASDFAHVTFDRGVVKSVSGQDLTITEGTHNATYKDATFTIPAGAEIKTPGNDNASLSDLQTGWRVVVAQLPDKTVVAAGPPRDMTRHRGFGRRR